MWIDRNPGTPRTPAFLLLHTTPDVVRASAVLAIGLPGDTAGLPEPLAAREAAPRTRRPLSDLLLPAPAEHSLAA